MKKINLILMALALTLMACQTEKTPTYDLLEIESPAKTGSEEPNLFTDSNGDVYLSWIEKQGNMAKLNFSKLEGAAWSSSNQISEGDNWFVNWADFPSLIVNNEIMAAHWLQKSNEGSYDYDVRMVMSSNSGKDWNESFVPHTDGVSAEHGFVSMLPMKNNQVFATWLDGRNTKGEEHAEGGHGGGAMTLRAAIFDKDGKVVNEWELDDRVCDCCQTSAAMTANGPVVVYRNRTEAEIRDMAIVRLIDGQWTKPEIIHADDWNIAGCPVNGPSIAADDKSVAVTWFTASGGNPMVKLAFSTDAGKSFSAPITISEGTTNGRVGTTMLPDGSVAISWMETVDDNTAIMLAHYDFSGSLLKKMEVAKSSSSRRSGFPVITSSSNTVYLAWTQTGDSKLVNTAKIDF
ncbi:MAG: hypothetical protein ACI82Q_001566 [Nonlabens sp.]|jgi:hypothetical protein